MDLSEAIDHQAERITMRFILSIRSLLFALVLLAISAASSAQVSFGVSIRIAPPELPVYEQPVCPEDGYIWTPGYWAYGDEDYYWVPGTWVMAPEVGYLWTPGYWDGNGGNYAFHEGYWGTEVGFYGGISYGYGYFGHGYEGGRWDNGHFDYNESVSHVDASRNHNVYNTRVEDNSRANRVSFNGGNGGAQARATNQEESAGRQRHIAPVAEQTQHAQSARANPELRASANQGKPPIAATSKPGAFKESGAVAAREGGAVHNAPAAAQNNNRPNTETNRPNTETNRPPAEAARPAAETNRPSPAVHARDIPQAEHIAPNTGNANTDRKYQQQQDKLQTQQVKERQTLQTRQEQDHQRLPQKPANEPKQQPLEQKHQQQTEQLAQKHTQQQQQLQQRQQPAQHQNEPKPAEKGKPAA
jgi:hypothetical protein